MQKCFCETAAGPIPIKFVAFDIETEIVNCHFKIQNFDIWHEMLKKYCNKRVKSNEKKPSLYDLIALQEKDIAVLSTASFGGAKADLFNVSIYSVCEAVTTFALVLQNYIPK